MGASVPAAEARRSPAGDQATIPTSLPWAWKAKSLASVAVS